MNSNSPTDHAITTNNLYGNVTEPTYSGVLSFMCRKYTKDLTGADVAITGIPLDLATCHRPGARFGPAAVRAASVHLAWFDKPWPWQVNPFEQLAVIDSGDCYFDYGKPETIFEAIYEHAKRIVNADVFMLSLGGDHYVTYPLLKAHAEKHGPLALIQFDAHSDTWEEAEKRMDHGSMFYHAYKEGLILPEKSVQIGIRTHNDKTHGFNILNAPWVMENGAKATAAEIKRIVGNHNVYLTFDIDCLDPSCAPATGTPVPGGLTSLIALQILRNMPDLNFVGMDVVEVAPDYDINELTALVGATIAVECLCLLASIKNSASKRNKQSA